MVLNKYLVAFLQLAIISVTALQAALADGLTLTEGLQLAALVVGAVVSIWAPLLETGWAAALKVGGAVLGAILAAVIPFATGGWTAEAFVIVVLAGLNALATQVGVDVRVDTARVELVNPVKSNATAELVDPSAATVAHRTTSGVG